MELSPGAGKEEAEETEVIDRGAIVRKLQEVLGEGGLEVFREYKRRYGIVSPVVKFHRAPPHIVFYREGMFVRNLMREFPECEGWTDHDFDEKWIGLIEEAIKE